MKHAILISFTLALAFAACQSARTKADVKPETTATSAPDASASAKPVYSCPMHSEVMGKMGDKCSKCNMDLTQRVYSCPMHPEVTGKAGDKCPKCKMDLTPKK